MVLAPVVVPFLFFSVSLFSTSCSFSFSCFCFCSFACSFFPSLALSCCGADEKASSLAAMATLNEQATGLEADIDALKQQLLAKENALAALNQDRDDTQRLMNEVDDRFGETLRELEGRESELATNFIALKNETEELTAMSNELKQEEENYEESLVLHNTNVVDTTKEWRVITNVHDDLGA